MFQCPEPEACAASPRAHRPYSLARGKNHKPSITELTEMLSGGGEGMAVKAGQIATAYTLHNYDTLIQMEEREAVLKGSRVAPAMWATDADMGTFAHQAAEVFAVGGDYTLPPDLYEHDAERLLNFVLAMRDWWSHYEPVMVASEFVVSNDDPAYVGTGDMIALIGDEPVYVDFKTKREKKDLAYFKKYKLAQWDAQCQAICLASHHRHYHGNQLVAETAWADTGLPRPERALILLLDHDGTWREFSTPIDPANMAVLDGLCRGRGFKPAMQVQPFVSKYPPRPSAPVSVSAYLD